jgi:hypothetical protein
MSGLAGIGMTFEVGNNTTVAATTTFTNYATIMSVTPPSPKVHEIKTTAHDTTSAAQTYTAGLIEPGEAKFTVQYDKTQSAAIYALLRAPKGFKIGYPDHSGTVVTDGSGFTFNGFVQEIGAESPIDDLCTNEVTVKVSGPVTHTATLA